MEVKRVVLTLSREEENTYTAETSFGPLKVGEQGYRPMELILVALAGCSGVDVANILRKKRQKVKDIRIEVLGTRREEHPRIYQHIKLKYIIVGEGIDPKAVDQAIELSVNKYCSVYAMLVKSVPIEVEREIWEEKG
ncbi:OsmC family protein [Thermocrinis albus DSM 14484]|uniref:OsmC family protein n=1 Tax=Thermocrinis albus (strain DSM 14484 / JCM 11386 / HI 11/12) TaxID=638303 RepID=D3SN32_THEAH|nr:OsmC family protein [Thermocrinis albus]ADC90162.1 OsmC family protein [Thermocrinis albus DSM 14484]